MLSSATPALTTVRGFAPVPASTTSAIVSMPVDEDFNRDAVPLPAKRGRPRRLDDIVSANCSPVLGAVPSPAISGIALLRMQLDPLSLNQPSGTPTTRTRSSSRLRANSRSDYQAGRSEDEVVSERTEHSSTNSCSCDQTGRSEDETISEHSSTNSCAGDHTGRSEDDLVSECSSSPSPYEVDLEGDFVTDGVSEKPMHAGSEGEQAPRKIQADDFEPIKCLGKGTYGTVLLVKQRATGRLYAQKQFKKASVAIHQKLVQQTKTERQILEAVNQHPFVVNLYYAFQDRERLYLILEYGQGGELFHHLNTEKMFSESTAAFYMAELVLALSFLHESLCVVYRDLKPENCLLDAHGHLLLTDFGLSKVSVDDEAGCKSMLGTVEYMAPEVILSQKYGRAVDWWSFGALGFDLMTGNPPFRGANNAKIQENIVKQKVIMPYYLSLDAKDLLARLLRKDPAKRLGRFPKDVETIKKHRFFRKIDWKKLGNRELEPPIQPIITDPELAENFSNEFTSLSLGPMTTSPESCDGMSPKNSYNNEELFGGFSFVAPSSVLEKRLYHQM